MDALRGEDRGLALRRTRDLLATAMESCEPRELASIARQYRETLRDIAALPVAAEEADPLDEIAKRRADRLAKTKAGSATAKGDKRGPGGGRSRKVSGA